MPEFWDDILGDVDEEEEEEGEEFTFQSLMEALTEAKGGLMDMLQRAAQSQPAYQEAMRYFNTGRKYILETYLNEEEDQLESDEGTPHCVLVDSVQIETIDDNDEELDDFMEELREVVENGKDDHTDLLLKLKKLTHHSIHIGMALGIGMLIDEGKVD